MSAFRCHYCRADIDTTELHTVVSNYPIIGCDETHFCAVCVDVDDPAEVRGEQVRRLFIALVTGDLDEPRILPGSA